MGFPGSSAGKESACNEWDLGSIPGLGRSPGGGHGNPLQYSCLENPHGQRRLVGYSPWGSQKVRYDWVTKHINKAATNILIAKFFVHISRVSLGNMPISGICKSCRHLPFYQILLNCSPKRSVHFIVWHGWGLYRKAVIS